MRLTEIAILDQVLQEHAAALGGDFVAYRNHACRIANFCIALAPGPVDRDQLEKIGIAAAFHDLGIWTHGTFDYLAPSIAQALAFLERLGRQDWQAEIEAMIADHHKITRSRRDERWLAEAFRRADWADVTLGLRRFGLPRELGRQARERWPVAGFHRLLLRLSLGRLLTHPSDPLPMFRL